MIRRIARSCSARSRFSRCSARSRSRLAAAIFALSASLSGAQAAGIAGRWSIERADASRACQVTLRAEEAAPGRHALGAPAGCRKALPILASAEGWSPGADGAVRLLAHDGAALLDFSPAAAGTLEARGPQGEVYRLSQKSSFGAPQRWRSEGAPIRLAQAQSASPKPGFKVLGAPSARAASGPARGEIPGRYAILREGGRDTGCMVTLEDKPSRAGKGASRAYLAPACRDQGLVIFDPVGWSYVGGRLALTARAGHTLTFLIGPDGVWSKEPGAGGKPVSLRKI